MPHLSKKVSKLLSTRECTFHGLNCFGHKLIRTTTILQNFLLPQVITYVWIFLFWSRCRSLTSKFNQGRISAVREVLHTKTLMDTHCDIYMLILILFHSLSLYCPVGWGCRIHRLHLCRELRHPNECPGYDNKQSDREVPVMQEL